MAERPVQRLSVLARQMTAASLEDGELVLADGSAVAGICPKALGAYVTHDNAELRARIMEFLKVRSAAASTFLRCISRIAPHALMQRAQGGTAHGRGAHPPARPHTPPPPLRIACTSAPQDDMYRLDHYLSLMEFRELTLRRLQKFVGQRFFSVRDYLTGAWLCACARAGSVCCRQQPACVSQASRG